MKNLVAVIRILVGALFIFSGFVKAVDPLGTSFKMHEYFEAFSSLGLEALWKSMSAWSTPIAVIMIVVEMVVGVTLLIGWKPRLTTWILFLMTLFFTLLTGFTYLSGYCPTVTFGILSLLAILLWIIAASRYHLPKGKIIFFSALGLTLLMLFYMKSGSSLLACNFTETKMKVTDCGCFGDFMKLKPWETFWKDIILDILIFILVIRADLIKPLFPTIGLKVTTAIATVFSLLFCFSNYAWDLPIIDFRPYKIGNNIKELRYPLKPEIREYVFVYKNLKTNEERNFKTDELDQIDDEWEFIDRRDVVVDPGIPAKINNLFIRNQEGVDITDQLLSNKAYSLMVVMYKLASANKKAITQKLIPLSQQCEKSKIDFYAVVGGDIDPEIFRHEMQTPFEFYTADETALKTIIRSNPGLVLLKDGIVLNKWHYRHLPSFDELKKEIK